MCKRTILVILSLIITISVVFASDISVGLGFRHSPLTREITNENFSGTTTEYYLEPAILGFIDAKYVLIELGYSFLENYRKSEVDNGAFTIVTTVYDTSYLTIGILGKYPFKVSSTVVLFPVLGLEYKDLLEAKNSSKLYVPSILRELNSEGYWLKIGCGADFNISSTIFIRQTFFYAYKLLTQDEKDYLEYINYTNSETALNLGIPTHDATIVTTKFDMGISIGFKF